jgi:hypothetical protein
MLDLDVFLGVRERARGIQGWGPGGPREGLEDIDPTVEEEACVLYLEVPGDGPGEAD